MVVLFGRVFRAERVPGIRSKCRPQRPVRPKRPVVLATDTAEAAGHHQPADWPALVHKLRAGQRATDATTATVTTAATANATTATISTTTATPTATATIVTNVNAKSELQSTKPVQIDGEAKLQ